MYWLLEYDEEERIRNIITNLQKNLPAKVTTDQQNQQFPFLGRKHRSISRIIIESLTDPGGKVCDPFSGSGTFAYASLDINRKVIMNEWEPYAYRLSTAPFRGVPEKGQFDEETQKFKCSVGPNIREIYLTQCPNCNEELMFDGLFFDRDPLKYENPTECNRMGPKGENIIFRGNYKCSCGNTVKHFDDFDQKVLNKITDIEVNFPNVELLENSRLNFTSGEFMQYQNLFSKRQQIALMEIYNYILGMDDYCKDFFLDAFLSIIHLAKYVDYRSKSQDNHCPSNRLKETNIYHRFLETLEKRYQYIANQQFKIEDLQFSNEDFRVTLDNLEEGSIDLLITDPPYGDNAQYFEHAQRVHPFMGYDLSKDEQRLKNEVVISDSKTRVDKHGKDQFLRDIETLFIKTSRVVKTHGFFCLYFRPQKSDWISDLNRLKHLGRKYGLEPLITIPVSTKDRSMRALASAAWSFSKDMCFIFLKLDESERRWYEGDVDVDELIYLAACNASDNRGNPFLINTFNEEFRKKLASERLSKLMHSSYQKKINDLLTRYCVRNNAQYILTGKSPYAYLNKEMNAEIRLREFAPIVIEELSTDNNGFTFEEYVIHLASYMDEGSREVIEKLHTSNRLVPELLLQYAYEVKKEGKFFIKKDEIIEDNNKDMINLYTMDPTEFEHLIADYFKKRGYIKAEVIGRVGDRGVDILVTNIEGELELIQCKRYRNGNNIGSAPIQRVDSYMRSRNAKKAWVITTSDFTKEGKDEARITGVILVNGDKLIQSLGKYYPGKYSL